MPRKIVKGNTENLNILNSKIKYIGFELEKVPEFLKDFEPQPTAKIKIELNNIFLNIFILLFIIIYF